MYLSNQLNEENAMSQELRSKIKNIQESSSRIKSFIQICQDDKINISTDRDGQIDYNSLLAVLIENPHLGEMAKIVANLLEK